MTRALFFASALLVPTRQLAADLRTLFAERTWDPAAITRLLGRYHTTPEMLFYRLSEVIPQFFRTKRIHFMKFTKRGEHVSLDKQLNMSRVHIPIGIGLEEHFCRRWLSVSILWDLEDSDDDEPLVGAQVSDFLGYESEFFCIAIAFRNPLEPDTTTSITLGFQVDNALRKTVRFWNDAAIPRRRLGQTCERCPLSPEDCSERAAPPNAYRETVAREQRKQRLLDLLTGTAQPV